MSGTFEEDKQRLKQENSKLVGVSISDFAGQFEQAFGVSNNPDMLINANFMYEYLEYGVHFGEEWTGDDNFKVRFI